MFKKSVSIVLSVLMIISLFTIVPFTANASAGGTDGNFSWTFNSITGKLTISGNGEMKGYYPYVYANFTPAPWAEYKNDIKSISIQYGITRIGDYAFYQCDNLKSVTMADSVQIIGYHTFTGCSSLENITIPNSVTFIGDYAFAGCSELKNIIFPEKIEGLGDNIFENCISLNNVVLPDSTGNGWIHIEGHTFTFAVGPYMFKNCKNLTKIILPETWEYLTRGMFQNCTSLEKYTIPNSIKAVCSEAFNDCVRLEEIYIPKSVTTIGESAFLGCSLLKNVYYEGSEDEWDLLSIDQLNETLGEAEIHFNVKKSPIEDGTAAPIETQPITDKPTGIAETTSSADINTDPAGNPTSSSENNLILNYLPEKELIEKSNAIKLVIRDTDGNITNYDMTPTAMMYDGVNIYSVKIPADLDFYMAQFQYYNGETWQGQFNVSGTQLEKAKGKIITSDGSVYGEAAEDKPTAPAVAAKKANPIKVSVKTKSVKLNKLKNKAQTVKAITIKSAKGKVSCKITKVTKIKKFLKINAKGIITFNKWKKAKKGTYSLKVSITAKGNKDYKPKTITKLIKIKVK